MSSLNCIGIGNSKLKRRSDEDFVFLYPWMLSGIFFCSPLCVHLSSQFTPLQPVCPQIKHGHGWFQTSGRKTKQAAATNGRRPFTWWPKFNSRARSGETPAVP